MHSPGTGQLPDPIIAVPNGGEHPSFRVTWRQDVPAAFVVFLVALPLCLGIALASGAPLSSGIIAGVVGGIVVGALSGSQLMVSGPAAGLTAIIVTAIGALGSFRVLLAAVTIAGVLQIVFGAVRAGIIGYYIPSAVIRGMLAAIGIILILKQLPHAVGYDAGFEGDEAFLQSNAENTFSAIGNMLGQVQIGAIAIAVASLLILALWNRFRPSALKVIPAPLLVVLVGIGANMVFGVISPDLAIRSTHLVQLPVAESPSDWLAWFAFPDWSQISSPALWRVAVTIAIVASLETLLSLEATDKMDPYKRESDTNRELFAQGAGNLVSGLIGGLPLTGVIVRSSANIDAGARTRWSAITHGVVLVAAVLAIPTLLNRIPLAALAAILLFTGLKLASPALFRATWLQGRSQFVPFATTVIAIVLTDLLVGIGIGLAVSVFFILMEQLKQPALRPVGPTGSVLTRYMLPEQLTFLHKANVERTLDAIAPGSRIEIDGRSTTRFDRDVVEQLQEFRETARLRNIDYRLVGVPETAMTPTH